MKKLLLIILLPFLSYGQVQIGQDIDGEGFGYSLGFSVSMSLNGNIIAIGAVGGDNGDLENVGHLGIYRNEGGNWIQIGENITGENESDLLGFSVSLSSDGNVVASASPYYGLNGDTEYPGHVQVYRNVNDNWVQIGQNIEGDVQFTFSGSGNAIDLSSDGNIIAVGSPQSINDGGLLAGNVRIFKNEGDNWIQIGEDINGLADFHGSGSSISLSSDGNIVAIGAITNSTDDAEVPIRVFKNEGDNWIQIGQDLYGDENGDALGWSVSLSSNGNILAIGAPLSSSNGVYSGQVKIFKNEGNNWIQIGENINGDFQGDSFGANISLSSDGNIVAIKAPFSAGNGINSGQVKIFKNEGDNWIQIGENINGESEYDTPMNPLQGQPGEKVSLSSDGSKLAIGAIGNDEGGNNSGHVRVFDISEFLTIQKSTLSAFTIYPNPASTFLQIELQENNSLEKITIYNSVGQEILMSKNLSIDTSSLSSGVYIVEVTTNQGKATQKLIIE